MKEPTSAQMNEQLWVTKPNSPSYCQSYNGNTLTTLLAGKTIKYVRKGHENYSFLAVFEFTDGTSIGLKPDVHRDTIELWLFDEMGNVTN